jgi:heavy metal sensor kinase
VCQVYENSKLNLKYYPLYFRVLRSDQSVYFESTKAQQLSASPFGQGKPPLLALLDLTSAHPYRQHNSKFTLQNGAPYIFQVAIDIGLIKSTLRNLIENILIVIPLLLMLSIGFGMFVSKRYRDRVRSITSLTNRITSQNLQERLAVPRTSDEIKYLILTLNSMIDRIEKSFKEIKQFTADVSHELRTPLFAMKGEMEVALSGKRTEDEYRDALAESLERINFLIKMVNDLFLVSRFDVKKMDIDLMYLNMGEIVRDLYDFYLPMAQEKALSFSIERCEDTLFRGDRTRIHQLCSNLIDNAIKFTPAQGAVSLAVFAKDKSIKFRVRDTGIGISDADKPNIFNRFFQGDRSRSGAARGSGLGLHICKRIVEAHDGEITVESNEGPGVTFIVRLPGTEQ